MVLEYCWGAETTRSAEHFEGGEGVLCDTAEAFVGGLHVMFVQLSLLHSSPNLYKLCLRNGKTWGAPPQGYPLEGLLVQLPFTLLKIDESPCTTLMAYPS